MKNLKKVFALVVVFAMVISAISMTSFAYSDVKSDANYAEAVTMCSSLGLLKGYDDGTFKPDGNITRAEFAAVVDRALGLENASASAKGTTIFTDVPADNWASGYINLASQQKFILGYGDGNFGPSDNVTFEQAVKMIVAAMGYTPKAESLGGYPSGYLVIAAQLGITDGVGAASGPASRATVAMLIYNALNEKLMEQTSYGKDPVWTDVTKTLLSDKLKIKKVEGIVVDNFANSPTVLSPEISLKINSNLTDNSADASGYLKAGEAVTGIKFSADTKANTFLGQDVVAYVKNYKDSDKTVIAIAPKVGQNSTITVNFDKVTLKAVPDPLTFSYWKNDADNNATDLTLDSSVNVIFNNSLATTLNTASLLKYAEYCKNYALGTQGVDTPITSGNVTLIDNDNDGKYEYVMINKPVDFVSDDVASSKGTITDYASGNQVTLDKTNTGYKFDISLLDTAAGTTYAITPADIKEYDVLSVYGDYTANTTSGSSFLAYNDSQSTYKAVTVVRNAVSGTISQITPSSVQGKVKYTLNGKDYQFSDTYINANLSYPRVSDTCTFYLDMFGKAAYKDSKAGPNGASSNYAILQSVGRQNGISGSVQFKMFNAKGDWVTYSSAAKFKINSTQYDASTDSIPVPDTSYIMVIPVTPTPVPPATAAPAPTAYPSYISSIASNNTNKYEVHALVTYKLDSAGALSELNFVTAATPKNDSSQLSLYDSLSNYTFYKATNKIDIYNVVPETAFFNIQGNGEKVDNYSVITTSSFQNGDPINCAIYDGDGLNAGAVLAYNASAAIAEESQLFVVDSTSTTNNANNESILVLNGYQGDNNTLISVPTTTDATVSGLVYSPSYLIPTPTPSVWMPGTWNDTASYNLNASTFPKGTVLQISKNSAGNADKIRVCWYAANAMTDKNGKYTASANSYTTFAAGIVTQKQNGTIQVAGATFPLNGANVVVSVIEYDSVNSRFIRGVGTGEIEKLNADGSGSKVFVRQYQSDTKVSVDIIIIKK